MLGTRVKAMTTGHAINALTRLLRLHTLATRSVAAEPDESVRADRLASQMQHWGVPEVIVLDEIHHPTTENFVIFMLLRYAVHILGMPIKVFVSSATLNSETLCRVSGNPSRFALFLLILYTVGLIIQHTLFLQSPTARLSAE